MVGIRIRIGSASTLFTYNIFPTYGRWDSVAASMPFQLLEQEWGGRREGMNQALQYFERRVTAIRVCVMIGRLWGLGFAPENGLRTLLKGQGYSYPLRPEDPCCID